MYMYLAASSRRRSAADLSGSQHGPFCFASRVAKRSLKGRKTVYFPTLAHYPSQQCSRIAWQGFDAHDYPSLIRSKLWPVRTVDRHGPLLARSCRLLHTGPVKPPGSLGSARTRHSLFTRTRRARFANCPSSTRRPRHTAAGSGV